MLKFFGALETRNPDGIWVSPPSSLTLDFLLSIHPPSIFCVHFFFLSVSSHSATLLGICSFTRPRSSGLFSDTILTLSLSYKTLCFFTFCHSLLKLASVVCGKWWSVSCLYFAFILRFCQFPRHCCYLSQIKNKPFSVLCIFLVSNTLKNIFWNSIKLHFRLSIVLCSSVPPLRLEVQCEVVDSEINHILPAFSVVRRECGLQREPLLFSCAGHSPKYRRLCPCRDFRYGQVALCRDCL